MSTTRYAVINDKIIVDRRKPQRNSEVSQFLRKNREMLVQKSDNPDFDREMLHLHARTMISSLPAISLLVFMIAVGGLFLGKSVDLLLWAIITISGYAGFAFAARRVNQLPVAEVQIVRTKRLFLALHCVIGLAWAYLAWSSCAECQPFELATGSPNISRKVDRRSSSVRAMASLRSRGAVATSISSGAASQGTLGVSSWGLSQSPPVSGLK